MRVAFAWLLAAGLLTACGEKKEPTSAPAPAPEAQAPDFTQTAIAKAPPGIQGVEYGKYCGEEKIVLRRRPTKVPQCIKASVAEGAAAWGTLSFNTIEGDPIPTTYVARSENDILVFQDATKDRFGSGGWTAFACRELGRRWYPPLRCSRPIEVDDRTPSEFLEREALPPCGRASIRAVGLGESPQANCLERTYKRGESAEVIYREVTEEGPITTYLRTKDQQIEVFTDATQGGLGSPAWYRQECGRLGRGLKVHACGANGRLPKL